MLILNDIHIGAMRKAGTTPTSQAALREFTHQQFSALLQATDEDHLVINGDLFDGFEVEGADLIQAFSAINEWFRLPGRRLLTLIAGNHDWNPRAGRVSSFHMLAHFLRAKHGSMVETIDYSTGLSRVLTTNRVWAIPHMPNQDLFDLELKKALDTTGDFLLLHANYDNNFAAEADHSLNVSAEMADALIQKGWTLIFGHEHQPKVGTKLVITGNQIPTSVADCLQCYCKYYLTLKEGELARHEWLNLDKDKVFTHVDWHELDAELGYQFIRVEGSATAEQASEAVEAVAKLRQKSQAFVITNAIKVDGLAEFDQLAEMSLEQITAFNVLDALLAELSEEEGRVVKELLE
ncbi:MAG TPA: metallophosphoesterase [Gemmatales bacterium]|nr:metallophosphoesterase [Gemmatales bacterium]